MEILDHFKDIIDATDALEVDGEGLLIEVEDPAELKYALMAMVLYSSRIKAKSLGWIIELESNEHQLFVQKVSVKLS